MGFTPNCPGNIPHPLQTKRLPYTRQVGVQEN